MQTRMNTGDPGGIRTPDPRLRRPLLYPTELLGQAAKIGAGDGNRTHVTSLEGWSSTIELHPRIIRLVGAAGFEPATPCSQGRCSTKLSHAPNYYISLQKLRRLVKVYEVL